MANQDLRTQQKLAGINLDIRVLEHEAEELAKSREGEPNFETEMRESRLDHLYAMKQRLENRA